MHYWAPAFPNEAGVMRPVRVISGLAWREFVIEISKEYQNLSLATVKCE